MQRPAAVSPSYRRPRAASAVPALLLALVLAACDHGLAPPEAPPVGAIRAVVTYAPPGAWPPPDSLVDLRFVAMRFVPKDTSDFLQLNRLVFSQTLRHNVARDTVVVTDVAAGAFFYSGVAQRYSQDLFAWRPVGLVEADGGVFHVRGGETTEVHVTVDFRNPPPFPPRPRSDFGF